MSSIKLNLQVKFGETSSFLVAASKTRLSATRGQGNKIQCPSEAMEPGSNQI